MLGTVYFILFLKGFLINNFEDSVSIFSVKHCIQNALFFFKKGLCGNKKVVHLHPLK